MKRNTKNLGLLKKAVFIYCMTPNVCSVTIISRKIFIVLRILDIIRVANSMTAILVEKENEDRISIQFGYSPDLVAKIRKVDGRKWLPDSKSWIAPNTDQTI